jgi:sigma-B regulation protein RsbU (phosphoserine phosphatase)
MTPRNRSPLIFIVDDDLTTKTMLESMLKRAGFRTECACDAASGWRGILERRPDLVLLDLNLPDGSGLDVCRRLQDAAGTAHTPVLFISSTTDVNAKVRCLQAGAMDYVTKPLAAPEVLARVRTHLRVKMAYEALAKLQAERVQRLAGAQQTLMPAPEELPEARFRAALKQAHKAGGDFYDVIRVGEAVFDYTVADASGHDLAASFWTAALKTLLGEYATVASSPLMIVQAINNALNRILPQGVFFTQIYARLNRQTGSLTVVNAGHPPALIYCRAGESTVALRQEGDVVGAFADATFDEAEVMMERGDRFYLYSDGLLDIGGDRERGLERLRGLCRAGGAEALETAVETVVRETINGCVPKDDVLFVGVEV